MREDEAGGSQNCIPTQQGTPRRPQEKRERLDRLSSEPYPQAPTDCEICVLSSPAGPAVTPALRAQCGRAPAGSGHVKLWLVCELAWEMARVLRLCVACAVCANIPGSGW